MSRLALLLIPLFVAAALRADDYELVLKDHKFTPAELIVPPDTKVKITVKNQDETVAEFESTDLNREKVVSGNKEVIIYVGPLDEGTYAFFDEFHKDTAKGKIVAKKAEPEKKQPEKKADAQPEPKK